MKYDKEFEEIVNTTVIDSRWTMKDRLWFVWQAARKDHYRIGEEVESIDGTKRAKICAVVEYNGLYDLGADNVRRIPAKSRIDEIAEEAVDKYRRGAIGAGSLTDIIKAAILKDREEREAGR